METDDIPPPLEDHFPIAEAHVETIDLTLPPSKTPKRKSKSKRLAISMPKDVTFMRIDLVHEEEELTEEDEEDDEDKKRGKKQNRTHQNRKPWFNHRHAETGKPKKNIIVKICIYCSSKRQKRES